MLKKIKLDSLRADLAAVTSLLSFREQNEDPIGWMQYSQRKEEIEQQIASLEASPDAEASVGLFFGGRPVIGSKGIFADFAGKTLEQFQDLVSKRYASVTSGPLGQSGPVPLKEQSQLLVTDVARGSFGFVLQEATETPSSVDSPLKQTVEEIAEVIYRVSVDDDSLFEYVAETLDDRLLGTLKALFKTLDDNGATLRVVEGHKEFLLDRESVLRARERTESMQLSDGNKDLRGQLYILPESRRFELHVSSTNEIVRGSITKECLMKLKESNSNIIRADILGKEWCAHLRVREVRESNRSPRSTYTLLEISHPNCNNDELLTSNAETKGSA
jgi:hypothetical protein